NKKRARRRSVEARWSRPRARARVRRMSRTIQAVTPTSGLRMISGRTACIDSNEEVPMAKAAKAVPDGYHTITPQLTLDNAAQTIDWYKKALGAEEVSRSVGPDGKIMHAELKIGNSRFMMNDVMHGGKVPPAFGGSPASVWLFV